ncbi:MAG: Hsp70 family protein [Reyranellaceae bacterium]
MGLIWIILAVIVVIAAATAFRALRRPANDIVAAAPPKAPPPPGGEKRWDIAPDGVSAGRYAADTTRNAQIGALAEWLVRRASRDTGIDLATDRMAVTRIAEAAGKAWPELQAQGRARITLPYIAADRDGPKHVDIAVDSTTLVEASRHWRA